MLNLLAALFASLAPAQAPLAPPRQLERVGEFTVGDGCSTKRIAFSGDGETLAALSHGNELLVFALATGQITTRRVLHSRTSSIALSPDGKRARPNRLTRRRHVVAESRRRHRRHGRHR